MNEYCGHQRRFSGAFRIPNLIAFSRRHPSSRRASGERAVAAYNAEMIRRL